MKDDPRAAARALLATTGIEPSEDDRMKSVIAAREIVTTASSKLLLGTPVISVPMAPIDGGLPSGLRIIGGGFADATGLRVADAPQQVTDWYPRLPLRAQEPG